MVGGRGSMRCCEQPPAALPCSSAEGADPCVGCRMRSGGISPRIVLWAVLLALAPSSYSGS